MTLLNLAAISERSTFTAFCKAEPALRLTIGAVSDPHARSILLAKVGWQIVQLADDSFIMCDADDIDVDIIRLEATDMYDALEEAVELIGWHLNEPEDYIGGNLTGGFSIEQT